ncbi:hypothetical protein LCM23_06175 [Cytobacillus kochii]|uniref:hypothetical protein n=1 Tax=Cytobacillus kochii TaxID=859143 RepID=UPI001CD69692|nr:hypothetical protein [Cytobacillus kochii]MCA1025671.1 hypothetical protein [Cytobacillus kochii]
MSMYQNIQDIMKTLWNDEELLRLLHYKPESLREKTLDPLNPSLPNILDTDVDWTLRENLVMSTPKHKDLDENPLCRLCVYLGDREPMGGVKSFHAVTQDLHIDILCHFEYENGDFRSNRIADKVSQMFNFSSITGLGKMDYAGGNIISGVPNQYVGYKHVFKFGGLRR